VVGNTVLDVGLCWKSDGTVVAVDGLHELNVCLTISAAQR